MRPPELGGLAMQCNVNCLHSPWQRQTATSVYPHITAHIQADDLHAIKMA